MTAPATVIRLDANNATQAWDLLSERVDAFINRWEANRQPPPLAEFLPEGPPPLRRMALVELIKVDLEYRWQEFDVPRTLSEYLEEFPELAAGSGVPCDLIYEEFHVRKQAGDAVEVQQYLEQFPQQAGELGRLLGMEAPHLTTALFAGERMAEIDAGQKIDEFDLLKQLGKGAFATVFLAWQTTMQRFVAVKISSDQGTEGQTLAQLEHENIVRVYDQKLLPERRLRLLYMQHIAGGTLQPVVECVKHLKPAERTGKILFEAVDRALERAGKPPSDSWIRRQLGAASWPVVVCWLGVRLANALDYAHRHHVLHRDVKPANVLLTDEGSPKLADFNISYSSELEGATPAAYFGGSLPYMSVEQLEACNPAHERQPDELDGRSDVYALAIMLWELLTGKRPFADPSMDGGWSETLSEMIACRRLGVTAEARAQLPDDCPAGLEEVLLLALAPERDDRFENAGQFARQLELCLRPRTQELFRPKRSAWRFVVRRFALVSLALAALVPNLSLSGINYYYNLNEILGRPPYNSIKAQFDNVMVPTVNLIVYPAGIAILCYLAWLVSRSVKKVGRGVAVTLPELTSVRRRCLHLGEYVAWVCIYGWLVTGLVLPLWIDYALRKPGLDTELLAHFMASHLLCGMIASTVSFFLVTFIAVRCMYPALIQVDLDDASAAADLARLGRRVSYYFGCAVLSPVLAVILLALRSDAERAFFLIMGVVGLIGFGVAFQLARVIQGDLAALLLAVTPTGQSLNADSGTVDSFWMGAER